MAAKVSVIVPARDCADVLGACLDALAAQTWAPREVIVVDDASSDRSAEVAREHALDARVIRLDQRGGFTGACLAGYEAAGGDWIALINCDAEPEPDWLAEAIAAADSDERIGVVASLVLLAEPAGTVDSAGLEIGRSGLASLRRHGQPDLPDERRPAVQEVFGATGAAALYRRSMLEQTGFFERGFFLYYEDVDLAYRARWHGFRCVLANRARALHRHSYVTGRVPSEKRYYLQRNRIRTLVRNWPVSWLLAHAPVVAAYDAASIGLAIREGSAGAALKARIDAVKALPGDLATRKQIMSTRAATKQQMKKWLSKNSRGERGDK